MRSACLLSMLTVLTMAGCAEDRPTVEERQGNEIRRQCEDPPAVWGTRERCEAGLRELLTNPDARRRLDDAVRDRP